VLVVGSFDEVLTLINVTTQKQNIVFGILLLISVLVPNGADSYHRVRRRFGQRARQIQQQQPTEGKQ
jgi:ribose/xylose/arabinose/galactoside ABC-type transport system permease subunit